MNLKVECVPADGLGTYWEKVISFVAIPRVGDELWIELSDGRQRLYVAKAVVWDVKQGASTPKLKVVQVPM